MKTITVRGIDPDLAERLKRTAADQSKSINQLVLDILRRSLGMEKQKRFTRIYKDLDHLFGSWTEEEFRAIQDKITLERKIDEELWDAGAVDRH
nr:toxin-antitoxin system HicB family antitoxin [Desulfobacterales bacterium]